MKRILYLGTDPSALDVPNAEVTHYPIIQIVPRPLDDPAYRQWDRYTHLIFTSKHAAQICQGHLQQLGRSFSGKEIIAVGARTAAHVQGAFVRVAEEETQEGVIALLQTLDLTGAHLFIPHSSRARSTLFDFLSEKGIVYTAIPLYDTCFVALEPRPQVEDFDAIVFTSPSTVEAFRFFFGSLPPLTQCIAIGPITRRSLNVQGPAYSEKK
jgi:uroporphyrinogen-III synthase